ncbi:MAG: HAD family hydrolase [Bacillaceae bacterium]
MKQLVEKCKIIIFDLDGTLYEGTGHYDYYANEIGKKVEKEKREAFFNDYNQIKVGNHLLKIGMVYDRKRDRILAYDPFTNEVTNVYTWEGQELFGEDGSLYYKEGIRLDETDMIAIGDGWWYTYVAGAHYGAVDTYECYNRTKEYMASEAFSIPKIKGLKEFLQLIKGEKITVLMTNSDREDVTRLLKLLDLEGMFSLEITSAMKPMKTKEHFQQLFQTYDVRPEEAVSIGDNFINEIAPALQLGMHGIYLSLHPSLYKGEKLFVTNNLLSLFE